MKFLVDENVSPGVVRALRAVGHDFVDVKEKGWQGGDEETMRFKQRTIPWGDRDAFQDVLAGLHGTAH